MAIKLNEDDLEKALSSGDVVRDGKGNEGGENSGEKQMSDMPKEEEIGFHKGSLNTLAAERNELIKMVANVEGIMQAHLKRLEELGVKIDQKEK
jgi:hypothetical protein|tara:strand:+ start:15 stop:296 length:282 start_codon:yes stop_codon:yes gene_type:complete